MRHSKELERVYAGISRLESAAAESDLTTQCSPNLDNLSPPLWLY